MLTIIKKIYTVLVLIKNLVFRKKKYTLHFVAEYSELGKRWYYDFKHWGFSHGNLEMVAGADKLCELYADGQDEVTVDIIAAKHPEEKKFFDSYKGEVSKYRVDDPSYDLYEGLELKGNLWDRISYGRDYQGVKKNKDGKLEINMMWICPVTLFVLGRYPNFIYIKKNNGTNNSK